MPTPLLRDLISIPEHVHKGDFVLRLTEGVTRPRETVNDYVVTPELARHFDEALGFIKSAILDGSSKATYLHGSFGSGKSHFMAILYLLLQHAPEVRSIPELADVVAKYTAWVEGKKFLLVPYHLIGARNLESAILGGYVEQLRRLHPEVPPPAVYLSQEILDNAEDLRRKFGEAKFLEVLNQGSGSGGWGALASGWTGPSYAAARAAGPQDPERSRLVSDIVANLLSALPSLSAETGEGFVGLDAGLAALSRHAQGLGYDVLVLFLDELILWLASHAGEIKFLEREGQKLAKLVETSTPDRPVPIVSFVARQRDLKELVGEHVPGAEKLGFADVLRWWEGRFNTIKLEDRNLPLIVEKRLLVPRSEEARVQLEQAFREAERARPEVLEVLRGPEGDRASFRRVYPFSPALIETLVAVSSALQRERTALKLLLQLLVEQRDTLRLGELVPTGDLWELLEEGDEPFSDDMRQHFASARKFYREKLRPMLEAQHGLAPDAAATPAFRTDDRLVKTLLLAALVPEAPVLRGLDAGRLAALNHGTLRTPIPGQEPQLVLQKARRWAGELPEIRIGEGQNPTISLQITGVDVESILAKVQGEDNAGNRRRKIRELLFEEIGIEVGEELFEEHDQLWRGTRRRFDVIFGNVREMPDESLQARGPRWRVVLDFPFDPEELTPQDDLERLRRFREGKPEGTLTVCWLPSFFSAKALRELGRLVRLEHALTGERFDGLAAHLSAVDRQVARGLLESQRRELRARLRLNLAAAYGIHPAERDALDPAYTLEPSEQVQSLTGTFQPRPPAGADLVSAFQNLLAQALESQFPGHPRFLKEEVRLVDLKRVLEEMERAVQEPGGRIRVEDKKTRELLQQVAEPLKLGAMHEAHFVLSDHWRNHLERQAHREGGEMMVGKLRAYFDRPQATGLPPEMQDLVILVVADQTNRSFHLHGGPAASGSFGLKDELVLREQPLPSADDWARASERAERLFGLVPLSSHLTASNVGDLVAQVAARAQEGRAASQNLLKALEGRLDAVGKANAGTRIVTAREGAQLLQALGAEKEPREAVRVLARTSLTAPEPTITRSMASAQQILELLGEVRWGVFDTAWATETAAAARNREEVIEALSLDELAIALAPRLRELEAEALTLISAAVKQLPAAISPQLASPPPAPVAPGRSVIAQGEGELTGEEASAKLEEIRELLDENPEASLELQWRLYGRTQS